MYIFYEYNNLLEECISSRLINQKNFKNYEKEKIIKRTNNSLLDQHIQFHIFILDRHRKGSP